MKSAQNRSNKSMAKTKWETEWTTGQENARHWRNIKIFWNHLWTQAVWSLTTTKACSIDRKTMHRPLPSDEYLHCFNIIETPKCECGRKGNSRSLPTKL